MSEKYMISLVIGLILICIILMCYSLIPSAVLKYLWKRKSRKRARTGQADRRLYLTFDDGPSRAYTGQLLCLLKQYQIKASFFVVAEFARENPDLIEWMEEEGHLVGIHSVQHKNALFRGRKFVHTDLKESVETLEDIGCKVHYYRPPWGHLNLWTLFFIRYWNLRLILWDVMANDWSARETAETIKEKILNRAFPGAVVCLHDGRGRNGAPERTIEALRESIPILLEQGYSFERMDAYEYKSIYAEDGQIWNNLHSICGSSTFSSDAGNRYQDCEQCAGRDFVNISGGRSSDGRSFSSGRGN